MYRDVVHYNIQFDCFLYAYTQPLLYEEGEFQSQFFFLL